MFHWQWVLTHSSGAFQSWYLGFVFKMATLFLSGTSGDSHDSSSIYGNFQGNLYDVIENRSIRWVVTVTDGNHSYMGREKAFQWFPGFMQNWGKSDRNHSEKRESRRIACYYRPGIRNCSSLQGKWLTMHSRELHSLTRSYLWPCTNSVWESMAFIPAASGCLNGVYRKSLI